jgi:threonine dehydratase
MSTSLHLPTIDDVRSANERLQSHAVRTPLIESAFLNARAGTRVLLKPEMLQRTGSFKFRSGGVLVRQSRAGCGRGRAALRRACGDRHAG